MKKTLTILSLFTFFNACTNDQDGYDASGTFEAVETIISAEASGTIKELAIEEGQELVAGQAVGWIDTVQLHLKKKQLQAQIKATGTRVPDIQKQQSVYQQQIQAATIRLNNLLHEQKRVGNLVKADAATPKQLDDINAQVMETKKQVTVIRTQEEAAVSSLQIQSSSLEGEVLPLYVQVEQINDQISKSGIINPVTGTVLIKYAEQAEMATAGKPLYKIADMSSMILRAYITGNQLSKIKLNQRIEVQTDGDSGDSKVYNGIVEWINSKAEFTPRSIQTRDERANQVYAVKVRVKNDGYLKIGMYGEIRFEQVK